MHPRFATLLTAALLLGTAWAPSAGADTPAQVAAMHAQLADWPNLARYRADNAALPPPTAGQPRVVFMGDSITDRWGRSIGAFFPGKPYVNRGISGQTTPQMLLRFMPDVVDLHPRAVVILGGTNDIAGNTGPSTPAMIEDNLAAMIAIAQHKGIAVVLASILPVAAYPWRPGIHPAGEIRTLNAWMRNDCAGGQCTYLDYYDAMADPAGGMRPGLSSDGVHPTAAGYAIMGPLTEAAIARALAH